MPGVGDVPGYGRSGRRPESRRHGGSLGDREGRTPRLGSEKPWPFLVELDSVGLGPPRYVAYLVLPSSYLHCESLAPMDFWTIADYLGGDVGQSAFEMFTAWWGAHGGSSGDTCPGVADCDPLARSISWLVRGQDSQCAGAGVAASKRIEAGEYGEFPSLPRGAWAMAPGVVGSVPQVELAVVLFRTALSASLESGTRLVADYVAHEEYHLSHPWSIIPPWGKGLFHRAAWAFGSRCGGVPFE